MDNEVEDMMDMGADFSLPIQVDLGVPDVQTTVGKLFSFSIPATAFSSGSSNYELKVFERLKIIFHFVVGNCHLFYKKFPSVIR